ncbi:hypothetical protein GCM10007977_053960 [Dactylosporangium sucinum]|uniref:3-ketoacyl-CoA thiolase n=1 Tax=Dactylosporangium sucinum TaxID=1424081 RepID=A0A917WZP3_9ACTN|nr:hypothetical protein GCM10007977_053960 [Dactylosporangium sucinum]
MVVGFVGLGNIGQPMAGTLAAAFPVVVYDVNASAAAGVPGARVAASLAELGAAATVVGVAVYDDGQVRDVVTGLLAGMRPGGTILVHSTISPGTVRDVAAQAGAAGVALLDVAVAGGDALARRGELTLMVGGDPDELARVRPVLDALGSRIHHVGPVGAGLAAKLANNLALHVGFQVLEEALAVGGDAGVGEAELLEVLDSGTARSWLTGNFAYYRRQIREVLPPGMVAKDLRAAVALAGDGADIPLTRLAAGPPREAVVVAALRTPLGRRRRALSTVRPDELLAYTLRRLVQRAGIAPDAVDDVIAGCVNAVGEQGRNIARVAALAAGLPVTVPGVTVNRMCGSSQQALHFAAHAVLSGQQRMVIAAGVESMSRVPLGADAAGVTPPAAVTGRYALVDQGVAADRIAARWHLDRAELDAFALASHRNAEAAWRDGRFADECVPVPADLTAALLAGELPDAGWLIERDEGIRPDTSLAALATLEPAFGAGGVHHAGNSSQLTDGAAAVLVCDRAEAQRHGLEPLARIVATEVVGVEPDLMLHGVIPVTQRILERTGLTLADIDLYEVNEAFASVPLAWLRETGADPDRLNVNGGAIALGHPTGCSGARLATTLLYELRRRGGRYGLQVMCTGYGMATATLYERMGEA